MSGPGWRQETALTEGVIGRRLLGWLVDTLLLTIVIGACGVVLFLFGVLTLGLAMPLLRGLWVVPILYTFLFTASPAQATPGQAIAGLRVVRDEDLGRPTPAQALVFAVGFWLTMASGVVWLAVALFTRGGRCLHDIVSGVVLVPASAVPGAAPWSDAATRWRGGFPPG